MNIEDYKTRKQKHTEMFSPVLSVEKVFILVALKIIRNKSFMYYKYICNMFKVSLQSLYFSNKHNVCFLPAKYPFLNSRHNTNA